MATPDVSTQKLAYAKELHKKGITAPAKIQQAVKKKFGTGMNFRDLGKINPSGRKKKKKKPVAKRGPGRPPKAVLGRPPKAGPGRPPKAAKPGKPGRPKGWSSGQWLLLIDGDAEIYGGKRALEGRVAELVAQGHAASALAVYEKATMKMTLKTSVTL